MGPEMGSRTFDIDFILFPLVLLLQVSLRILALARLLGVLLALLERSSLVRLCLGPLIVVVRGGHVQAVDAAILRGMLRAPDIFATLVFDGVPLCVSHSHGVVGELCPRKWHKVFSANMLVGSAVEQDLGLTV